MKLSTFIVTGFICAILWLIGVWAAGTWLVHHVSGLLY